MSLIRFYHTFGWKAVLLLAAGTVLYIFAGAALSSQLGWPEQYGLSCSGRGCLLRELGHSLSLIRSGKPLDYLMFAWLWLVPVAALGLILLGLWDARRRSRGLVYPSQKYPGSE